MQHMNQYRFVDAKSFSYTSDPIIFVLHNKFEN